MKKKIFKRVMCAICGQMIETDVNDDGDVSCPYCGIVSVIDISEDEQDEDENDSL